MDDEHCNSSDRLDFLFDLNHVLKTLEKVNNGLGDHVDYVKAYEYFVHRWGPK